MVLSCNMFCQDTFIIKKLFYNVAQTSTELLQLWVSYRRQNRIEELSPWWGKVKLLSLRGRMGEGRGRSDFLSFLKIEEKCPNLAKTKKCPDSESRKKCPVCMHQFEIRTLLMADVFRSLKIRLILNIIK